MDYINIRAKDTADTSFDIKWNLYNPTNQTVTVTLFYSGTNSQTQITSLSGTSPTSYTWNTSAVPEGEYYIRGQVTDGATTAKGAVSRIPLFPSGPQWERLEEWAGGRTVGELFGAASERAGTMAKGLLRQYRVGAGLAQTAVHKEVQPLLNPKTTSPEVMMDVARWANPKSNVDVSKLPEESLMTIAKIENAVSGLLSKTSQRKVAYDTVIQTNFNKRFSNLIKFEDATLEPIRERLAGIKTFDESYKELGKIIEDPKFSPQVRELATELYNLPAKLPKEIYRAYTDSLYKVTTAKIKANPNWAYSTVKGEKVRVPKEGYRESKQKGMEGYIVRKDVDNALRELNYTQQHGQRFHQYLLGPNQPCPFLQGILCTVYDHRPDDCQSYPHLHKRDFIFRMNQALSNCSICPIVFNVYEQLKREMWKERPLHLLFR